MLGTSASLTLLVFLLLLPLMRAERKEPLRVTTIEIRYTDTERENLKDFRDHPPIGGRLDVVV